MEPSREGLAGPPEGPRRGCATLCAASFRRDPRGRSHVLFTLSFGPAQRRHTQWKGWTTANLTVTVYSRSKHTNA